MLSIYKAIEFLKPIITLIKEILRKTKISPNFSFLNTIKIPKALIKH